MTPPDDEGPELAAPDSVLAFAQIGVLHLTDARQRSVSDLLAIVAQTGIECGRTIDVAGRAGQHTLRAASPDHVWPARIQNGSDAAVVGAGPENGILANRLGPNRHGEPTS